MKLLLEPLAYECIPGIYGRSGTGFPRRMAYLHPDAASLFAEMQDSMSWSVTLSDCWRSSVASLNRKWPPGRPMRPGTQPPAFSAHNYGLAIDIDVDRTLRVLGCSKEHLDVTMAKHHWFCHRRDHRRGREDWHYNCLGVGGHPQRLLMLASRRSTARAVEHAIVELYGRSWEMTPLELQQHLAAVRLYDGELDAIIGPLSISAIKAFQRAWHLKPDGDPGPRTRRTLAFRVAELECDLVNHYWNVRRA